jgi:hypothetical protein
MDDPLQTSSSQHANSFLGTFRAEINLLMSEHQCLLHPVSIEANDNQTSDLFVRPIVGVSLAFQSLWWLD